MTATRVEVQEYDEEVMTYSPVRNWHAVSMELKAQVRQLQLDNVLLQEKQAQAVTLLDHVLSFFDNMPFDDYPPVLDNMIREYKRGLDSVPGGTE